MIRACLAALAAAVALVGSPWGPINAARAGLVPSGVAVIPHRIMLSGAAVQGPMAASKVALYTINPKTGASVALVSTGTTDDSGSFAIVLQAHSGPLRLMAKGGSFTSEMDGSTIGKPGTISLLLPGAATSLAGISINPLTTFIDALAIARLKAGGTTLSAALANATATIESYYGLSTDPGTLAPDYTMAGVGTDAGNLGLVLGASINEDQHLCPGAPGGLVAALAADLSDGVFDGRKAGTAVAYCGAKLPAIAGTSDFQDALSGVQQLQYVSAGFAFGGLYGPVGNILLNQDPPVTPDLLLSPLAMINAAVTKAAPSTSSTSSPPMTMARGSATATLLPNGKVLIAGGFDGSTTTTNGTELYDPATNTLSAGPPLRHARGEATATLLPNGKVLVAGGNDGTNPLMSTELYDIATNTFSPGPSMVAARFAAGATLLANGKMLIAGGNGLTSGGLSSTELYDPSANSFAAGPSMSVAQGPCTAILMPNGKVLIVGDGFNIDPNVSVAELYDPADNSMAERSLDTFRQYPAVALLPDGKVLIAGGVGASGVMSSTQIYDPAQDAFTDGPSMSNGHWFATAAPTANGKILIIGGNGNDIEGIDSVDVYDSVTNSFSAGTPMNDPRVFATATLLPNGRVLIAGGWDGSGPLASTEFYTP